MKNDTTLLAATGNRHHRRSAQFSANQHGRALKIAIVTSVLLLVAPAVATAEPSDPGQQIAAQGVPDKVAACSSCHGPNGEGSAVFPYLRGTAQEYLLAQLQAFSSGARRSILMEPIAQGLSKSQRSAVAAYYSRLAAPDRVAVKAATDPSRKGAWLAARGRWNDDLPGCAQCHGPAGAGVGTNFPPLAGLPKTYIIAQLQAFASGSRPPGPLGLMSTVAKKLSADDIQAVSAYYAGLGAESRNE